jgi:hypothetical protein
MPSTPQKGAARGGIFCHLQSPPRRSWTTASVLSSIISMGSLRRSKLEPAIGCTNRTCFSPDKRTFNCADSVTRTISAYDYDLKNKSHLG